MPVGAAFSKARPTHRASKLPTNKLLHTAYCHSARSKTIGASQATDPTATVTKQEALDTTEGHKLQQNVTEHAEKQASSPKLVLKNVAVARSLTGYAQMVTP